MNGTYSVSMGDHGRLIVPLELRERFGLTSGTPVLLVETSQSIVLTTRERAKALVRGQLRGRSLVAELLSERRHEAVGDDG